MKPLSSFQTKKPLSAFNAKPEETYGAFFPASKSDSPLQAGLKSLGNVPSSAYQFGKGLFQAVAHPVQTGKALFNTATGAVETGLEKLTGIETNSDSTAQFDTLASVLKERYGSLENLQRTATNDPFGFGADILGVLEGGAATVGRSAQLTRGLTTVAREGVISPASKVVGGASDMARKTGRFVTSQTTGLNPETVANIIESPAEFSRTALQGANRETLAQSVGKVIDKRIGDLADTGKGYETIRQTPSAVSVPQGTVQSVLDKYGIKVVDGKVKTTAETIPLSPSDKTALADFLNVYGNEAQLSSNAFLNTRAALSELARYEATRTGNLQKIARDLRATYDDLGKSQIPGLKELDEAYAPEVKLLNQIKKDYLKPDGTFKDGAVSKLANLTGKGKEQTLARLEKIMPGITQRVKILKAAEDIERAAGLKVGTYLRSGGAISGLMTGNIPLIVGAIISSPEIAVRLLRAYGYTKKNIAPVVQLLREVANDVNNFRLPGQASQYIQSYLENPRVGMSIEDVTKRNGSITSAGKLPRPNTVGSQAPKKSVQVPKSYPNDTIGTSVVKGEEALLTEARKYKSAEEFVKAKTDISIPTEPTFTNTKVSADKIKSLGTKGSYDPTSYEYSLNQLKNGKPVEPIEVILENGKYRITDGEHRFKAYKELGIKEIPVKIEGEPLTKSQLTDIWKKAHR